MTDINHTHKYIIILTRITPHCVIQREGHLSLLTERQHTKTITRVCSNMNYFAPLTITRVHSVLVGKPEGKRPLGRPRRSWEDNIKMDLQEVGGGRGDWMELGQDRDRWRAIVGTVRNFRVP